MSRRDIDDLYRKIDQLEVELRDLEYTPFKTGYQTLIQCTKDDIEFYERKIIEAEKQWKYERTGKYE